MQYIDISLPKIISAKNEHTEGLKELIKNRASNSSFPIIKNIFEENDFENITLILESNPRKLHQLQLYFLKKVITNFKYKEWLFYIGITRTKDFTNEEKRIKRIFDPTYKEIKRIFDYDNFTEKKVNTYCAYYLAEKLDIPTCVYCNRIYTKTVILENKDKDKATRPTFDHWYPKSSHPLLALSFYNLIPCCTICNSGVKGTVPFKLSTHFHPYHRDNKNELKYRFSYDHIDYDKFCFKIKTDDDDKFSKDSVNAFQLENIYQAHEDEIEDLRRIKDAYSEDYIKNLEEKILCGISLDRNEVYRLAFGVHFEEAKFDRRPLSKMKKDILIELGIIKNN